LAGRRPDSIANGVSFASAKLCGFCPRILGERAEVEDVLQVRERFEEAARQGEAPALATSANIQGGHRIFPGTTGALARRDAPALHALRREQHLAAVLRRDRSPPPN